MKYFALTQQAADWLQGKPGVQKALHTALLADADAFKNLTNAILVEGPFRIAASYQTKGDTIIAMWNVDYLSGTGEEPWGFICIDGKMGLASTFEFVQEVFERCVYVINQRLQALHIDGSFIHRSYPNGAHTCMAGRGTNARQVSLGYFERSVDRQISSQRSIVCVGPEYDFDMLCAWAAQAGENLDNLTKLANKILVADRPKAGDVPGLSALRKDLGAYGGTMAGDAEYSQVEVETRPDIPSPQKQFTSSGLTYQDWMENDSSLSETQRRILMSDAIEKHPLRIVGPGGSGKTLLMQMLALRRLQVAAESGQVVRVLYIVHNSAMAESVTNRFSILDPSRKLLGGGQLDVLTMVEYGRRELGLEYNSVIDPDAYQAKKFQYEQVVASLRTAITEMPKEVANSKLFCEVSKKEDLLPLVGFLLMAEISSAIKGHGLESDKRRYIESERQLSRLHGVLSADERAIVYRVYENYRSVVFEQFEVLDTDDIALSLLGRLRTPIWELKRRQLGYDYVFVDETQLFNENERRVLALLTNGKATHVPIVLALDEAQNILGQSTAGLATLGIPNVTNESLASIHRSTRAIVRLAFFVIQRSTDLFGPDFPDFTGIAEYMEPDTHPLAAPPLIETASTDSRFEKYILKRVRELRKANIRQIAVICYGDSLWDALSSELSSSDLPIQVLLKRGEKLAPDQPIVVLTRPPYVGGQEFDAVLLVGLEQGLIPPRVPNNDALAAAVEQQSIREIYLGITRARYRVTALMSAGSSPTAVLQEAVKAEFIAETRR